MVKSAKENVCKVDVEALYTIMRLRGKSFEQCANYIHLRPDTLHNRLDKSSLLQKDILGLVEFLKLDVQLWEAIFFPKGNKMEVSA